MSINDFDIKLINNSIILSGEMRYTYDIRVKCKRLAREVVQKGSKFIVDSRKVKLFDNAQVIWVDIVEEILSRCTLIYLPSPLSQNLEYDRNYHHHQSIFLEEDNYDEWKQDLIQFLINSNIEE